MIETQYAPGDVVRIRKGRCRGKTGRITSRSAPNGHVWVAISGDRHGQREVIAAHRELEASTDTKENT